MDEEKRREIALQRYDIIDTLPEPNFDRITKLVASIFGLPVCTLSFVDHDRFWFKSKFGVDATEMPRSTAFCNETIRSNEVFVVANASRDPRFLNAPVVAMPPHFRFYAGAPLVAPSGACVGSLCVLDTESHQEFSINDRSILAALAATVVELLEARTRQIALAERNAQIEFLAKHDPLTGLGNRRRLQEMLEETRDESHIALFYLDLDGFKNINDRLGHAVGDTLLKQVADRIQISLPAAAHVARLGGDEFAVVLRDGISIMSTAENLARDLVMAIGRPYQIDDHSPEIGVSIGVAIVRGDYGLDASLLTADNALYVAKVTGRGRYHIVDMRVSAVAKPART
ncbi:sensor domain-containing diguanylate cyclase [Acidisoma cladoniae]|jgi:diguanylate cyclase (GGDEF)-like protein|uniref:sensor domain-containing diguanylate cyclase n=1 Tax=Acidisoma cladoniae TaxID=3040935 RepID=UPI0025501958|nr:sensor domain-containing diguanylate cyclase [Acidisoma sp. PAMC 29798]